MSAHILWPSGLLQENYPTTTGVQNYLFMSAYFNIVCNNKTELSDQ